MFCPKCNNQLEFNAIFCNNCGQAVVQQANTNDQFVDQQIVKKPFFTKKKIVIMTIIFLLLVITGLVVYFVNNRSDDVITDNSIVISSNDSFLFQVEDFFTITKEEVTVVAGIVDRGSVKVGDEVEIVGYGKKIKVTVNKIYKSKDFVDDAVVGDNVAVYFKDLNIDNVKRGQVIAKVNSIGSYKKFKADIVLLKNEEGSISESYSPKFYIWKNHVQGKIEFPHGLDKISFGDSATIIINLDDSVAIEIGTKFDINSSDVFNKKIGSGEVVELIN